MQDARFRCPPSSCFLCCVWGSCVGFPCWDLTLHESQGSHHPLHHRNKPIPLPLLLTASRLAAERQQKISSHRVACGVRRRHRCPLACCRCYAYSRRRLSAVSTSQRSPFPSRRPRPLLAWPLLTRPRILQHTPRQTQACLYTLPSLFTLHIFCWCLSPP
jgi:hypothetical protein